MSQMDPVPPPPLPASPARPARRANSYWFGGILILIGVYFLLSNLGFLDWLSWDVVWPVILIALGIWLVVRRLR